MDLAVRTTASPAAIWAICVVAVACLAFWLIMIWYADRHPYVRNARLPEMPGPVLGGIHLAEGGRSVAPNRELPADLSVAEPQIPLQRAPQAEPAPAAAQTAAGAQAEPATTGARAEPAAAGAPAEPVTGPGPAGLGTRADPVPAQRTTSGDTTPADTTAEAPTEPIPAQRAADADQPTTRADTGAGGGRS